MSSIRPPYFIDYGKGSKPRPIKRGDAWTVPPFRFFAPEGEGEDWWDGLEVKAQLRESPDGELLHEFDLQETVSTEDGRAILTLQLQMEPDATTPLVPGTKKFGDIEIATDVIPKVTAVEFRVPCKGDITHED